MASASTQWLSVMHRLMQLVTSSGHIEGYGQRVYDACKRYSKYSVELLATLDTQVDT